MVYLISGMIFLKKVKGASGVSMIPNYEFWISVPSDVKVKYSSIKIYSGV